MKQGITHCRYLLSHAGRLTRSCDIMQSHLTCLLLCRCLYVCICDTCGRVRQQCSSRSVGKSDDVDFGGKSPEVDCAQSIATRLTSKPVPSQRSPLYSMPHFSFTITGFPVSSFKNGFGFTGVAIVCLAPLCCYAIGVPPSKITSSQPCSSCLVFFRSDFPTRI